MKGKHSTRLQGEILSKGTRVCAREQPVSSSFRGLDPSLLVLLITRLNSLYSVVYSVIKCISTLNC